MRILSFYWKFHHFIAKSFFIKLSVFTELKMNFDIKPTWSIHVKTVIIFFSETLLRLTTYQILKNEFSDNKGQSEIQSFAIACFSPLIIESFIESFIENTCVSRLTRLKISQKRLLSQSGIEVWEQNTLVVNF